ncbi:hypothetical protein E4U24_003821, partial [Claviceps purpurea]
MTKTLYQNRVLMAPSSAVAVDHRSQIDPERHFVCELTLGLDGNMTTPLSASSPTDYH